MIRNPVPPDAVGLRVEISIADRDKLRVMAAQVGKSMNAYIRELISAHVNEGGPEAKPPKGKSPRSATHRPKEN